MVPTSSNRSDCTFKLFYEPAVLTHSELAARFLQDNSVLKAAVTFVASVWQGADGDFYYILDSGRADVLIRKGKSFQAATHLLPRLP